MAISKIQTGLRLEENLYEKVKTLSEIEGRSLNNLIEYIVRSYVSDYEGQHGILPQRHD